MSDALERLAEIVRQAESKTRAQKLEGETRQAAERLSAAEARMREADRRLHEVRPVRQRELEKCAADEARLRELMKKLAQAFSHLEPLQQRAAEQEIAVARQQITETRQVAQGELESILKEADAARRELRAAREQYNELRHELDQLLPHLADAFVEDDRLARDAEVYFPVGQIQALSREIDDGERHFSMLDQREQFAQLKIWIGRFRRLQTWAESDEGKAAGLTEDDLSQLREIFPRLVGISKQHMPGYIEAFSRAFVADWDDYVAEATEQLRQASELASRARQLRHQAAETAARSKVRQDETREAAEVDLHELKAVIARHHLPDDGVDEFLAALEKAVKGLGQSDSRLLDLVRPYAELLTGPQFRALRRNFDREDEKRDQEEQTQVLRTEIQDLLAATRGQHAVIIGGDPREENRRQLELIFEFDELEWVPYESARPALLDSLAQRVRNHGMDLVLILKEFVGHNLSDTLRPLCDDEGIPCLFVDRGYGASQIAQALRRGLSRLGPTDGSTGPPSPNGQGHASDG